MRNSVKSNISYQFIKRTSFLMTFQAISILSIHKTACVENNNNTVIGFSASSLTAHVLPIFLVFSQNSGMLNCQ